MKNTRNRIVAVLAATAVGGFAIAQTQSDTVEYHVSGWCLSHKKGTIEYASKTPAARMASPLFFVPSDIPARNANDAPAATGLSVFYDKKSISDRQGWIDGTGLGRGGCLREESDFGLVRLTGDGHENCRLREHVRDYYEAAIDVGPFAAVNISCSLNAAVNACKIRDVMPNGWQASISLPKTHLHEWRAASASAQSFFDNNLKDCGDKE